MWVYLNNSFLSIAAHEEKDEEGLLHVRARKRGDIEVVFPEATIKKTPRGNYKYHALIDRATVSMTIAHQIASINYKHLIDDMPDDQRYSTYMDVWAATHGLDDTGHMSSFPLTEDFGRLFRQAICLKTSE